MYCLVPMKLCIATSNYIVTFEEFVDFFKKIWAPRILEIHRPSGDIISTFMSDIISRLQLLPTHKVELICKMLNVCMAM